MPAGQMWAVWGSGLGVVFKGLCSRGTPRRDPKMKSPGKGPKSRSWGSTKRPEDMVSRTTDRDVAVSTGKKVSLRGLRGQSSSQTRLTW